MLKKPSLHILLSFVELNTRQGRVGVAVVTDAKLGLVELSNELLTVEVVWRLLHLDEVIEQEALVVDVVTKTLRGDVLIFYRSAILLMRRVSNVKKRFITSKAIALWKASLTGQGF